MSATMRRVVVDGLNLIRVDEVPVPHPSPGEMRVQVHYVGICGSDTHALVGLHPLLPPSYAPGHEMFGVVDEVGEGVAETWIGQRVAVQPNLHCGDCENCAEGRTNACQSLRWIGCDPSGSLPGGMARYATAPAANIFAIPDHVSDLDAVLAEPLATPVHAARVAGDLTGKRVVVIGAGTIGLLSLVAARRAGAAVVVVCDLEASKMDRALEWGADGTVDGRDPDFSDRVVEALGGLADVVFDCVAEEATIGQAVSVLRRAGTVLVVGVPPTDVAIPLPLVQDWELRIQGCANYTAQDFEAAIAILADGELGGERIITGHYGVDEAVAAFEAAAERTAGKVVIDPRR